MAKAPEVPEYSSLRCLQKASIINRSGFDVPSHPHIEPVREGYFRKMNWTIVGEAPKDFLRIYEHGTINWSNSGKWPGYIAKVGQKWYPNESITEHLLTRLGQAMGLNITDSRLMWVRGQPKAKSDVSASPLRRGYPVGPTGLWDSTREINSLLTSPITPQKFKSTSAHSPFPILSSNHLQKQKRGCGTAVISTQSQ